MTNKKTIYLNDYQQPAYVINRTELSFELETTVYPIAEAPQVVTIVKSRLEILRNDQSECKDKVLRLDGQNLQLQSVLLNGQLLTEADYQCTDEQLIIPDVPFSFILEVETWIKPEENKALEGLYQSSGNFCTQCEAEGFRRITYYLDQPDVMSSFTTAIVADKEKYPILLSNGNLVEQGELPEGHHYAIWHDPFKKPCYLFALVAGDLLKVEDSYTTLSGKNVTLQLFVEQQNAQKCEHAMNSLKNSMMWDEEVFGLEYDLDIYMIVAVEDFNMGAMENKGLNVFNAKYVLADPQSATDNDYEGIEGVIGHEYFHNWTGNRVTCRDWFQLSLKEGLTVFRDQEFTSDMQSRAVKRISDVRILRAHQFAEDASPMAHPIRPAQYMEINNFYTVTVYNKGAEVIRMIHTVLGEENFRKGMDLYFERHDGQAVTTEDFVAAMSDASGIDLSQFSRWYNQAGTPRVKVNTSYLADEKKFIIDLQQLCDITPYETLNSPDKKIKDPFYIPIKMGLLNQKGEQIVEDMIVLKEAQQTIEYYNIDEKPVLSLLRDFSAPVILQYPAELSAQTIADERAFLMAYDSDPFNRWEAGQQLAAQLILDVINSNVSDAGEFEPGILDKFIHGCQQVLTDSKLDNSLKAQALVMPAESYLLEQLDVADVDAVFETRKQLKLIMAERLNPLFQSLYNELTSSADYQFNAEQAGKRSLRNLALSFLMAKGDEPAVTLGYEHFSNANNMTDSILALAQLTHIQSDMTQQALDAFEQRWSSDALVMDKWLIVQAAAQHENVLSKVKSLMEHPCFDLKNPNKVRSLIGSFAGMNLKAFHHINGEGYQFVMDQILALDKFNPQIAARMVKLFSRWRRYDDTRQNLMKAELERAAKDNLSPDVFEIVTKSLK
ncbi:MAG: aminopeptidase N [gamma proteobacterium symbiont of Bathyaustriella thionipta]|nr:aminopeptidase N [gamma proteobacterium symbiont of Bathyaustriella thionipta]MCU7950430.1 aminopeptidase N [gamma proteobacterium symbiont of Bathyaustriella thionipta]MCU7953422.1 aminopeptidase N [gamma proteobacterium symbiont of Bathyaustriella thionipta]MCU7956936.1 aminopeptidase N [gamma proteobacterium symbiont of Bathyaustriella thionipta]MCU7966976.1 aminopeptidase N [gamma proteobacterium symbiont of Bathyaustriella thionipta]